jgi:hypothetical protein
LLFFIDEVDAKLGGLQVEDLIDGERGMLGDEVLKFPG